MKSAMMCFVVRSSIHPTNGPTKSDDDMDGNDKTYALCSDFRRSVAGANFRAISPNFFSYRDNSDFHS